MRRLSALLFAVVALVVASGAVEAKPMRFSFAGAGAYWSSTEQVSPTMTRETFWDVEAFSDRAGNYAFLSQGVWLCTAGIDEDDCQLESYRDGTSDGFPGFAIDRNDLSWAALNTVFNMQSYDDNFEPVGAPVAVTIDASWTGAGDLEKYSTKLIEKSKCTKSKQQWRDTFRQAGATAALTEGGVTTSLGDADYAFLGKTTAKVTYKSCDDEPPPFALVR